MTELSGSVAQAVPATVARYCRDPHYILQCGAKSRKPATGSPRGDRPAAGGAAAAATKIEGVAGF